MLPVPVMSQSTAPSLTTTYPTSFLELVTSQLTELPLQPSRPRLPPRLHRRRPLEEDLQAPIQPRRAPAPIPCRIRLAVLLRRIPEIRPPRSRILRHHRA